MAFLNTLYDFPAFKVLEAPEKNGVKKIVSAVELYINGKCYYASSVMSYAIENNECPIEAFERAVELGQKVYWIGQSPVSISNTKVEKKTIYGGYEIGDKVCFLGKSFLLESAPNDNIKLIEV